MSNDTYMFSVNPIYVNFFTRMISNFKYKWSPGVRCRQKFMLFVEIIIFWSCSHRTTHCEAVQFIGTYLFVQGFCYNAQWNFTTDYSCLHTRLWCCIHCDTELVTRHLCFLFLFFVFVFVFVLFFVFLSPANCWTCKEPRLVQYLSGSVISTDNTLWPFWTLSSDAIGLVVI